MQADDVQKIQRMREYLANKKPFIAVVEIPASKCYAAMAQVSGISSGNSAPFVTLNFYGKFGEGVAIYCLKSIFVA